MKRSDWGKYRILLSTATRRVEPNTAFLPMLLFNPAGCRPELIFVLPPIASLHWGLFIFNPSDYLPFQGIAGQARNDRLFIAGGEVDANEVSMPHWVAAVDNFCLCLR